MPYNRFPAARGGEKAAAKMRKGLQRKSRSKKGGALFVRNWSGKPGFRRAAFFARSAKKGNAPKKGCGFSSAFILGRASALFRNLVESAEDRRIYAGHCYWL
jgi:hypothetical protein